MQLHSLIIFQNSPKSNQLKFLFPKKKTSILSFVTYAFYYKVKDYIKFLYLNTFIIYIKTS